MSKRDEFVEVAQSQVGVQEVPVNQVEYNDWYYGRHVSGDDYPWCAVFVSWCAMACGILDILVPMQNYVPSVVNWYKNKGLYHNGNYTPKKGDLAIFTNQSHIGIVEYNDGRTHTIEGNKSNMVKRCSYNTYGSIIGYCEVPFNNEPEPPEPYTPTARNRVVQEWLNEYGYKTEIDGIAPLNGETFKNIVKVYQNELNKQFGAGLKVDGIYGALTYNASWHVISKGDNGNITKSIQAMLSIKGYEVEFNGNFGDDTEYTLNGYQHDIGMEIPEEDYGKLTQDTSAQLFT